MADDLLLAVENGIATLTLNRPEKRNALTRHLITALKARMEELAQRSEVRVVIVTGAGRAFCAGLDLDEVLQHANRNDAHADSSVLYELFTAMRTLPQAIIAAVNGHATAGGAGLMTACDLVVMSTAAKVGYPETKRGLVAAIVMPMLLRQIGERRGRQLLLSGAIISAEQALQFGLINELAEPDKVMEQAVGMARDLLHCGPQAVALTKRYLAELIGQMLPGTEQGVRVSAEIRLGEEAAEGLRAFLEKRQPAWCPPTPPPRADQ